MWKSSIGNIAVWGSKFNRKRHRCVNSSLCEALVVRGTTVHWNLEPYSGYTHGVTSLKMVYSQWVQWQHNGVFLLDLTCVRTSDSDRRILIQMVGKWQWEERKKVVISMVLDKEVHLAIAQYMIWLDISQLGLRIACISSSKPWLGLPTSPVWLQSGMLVHCWVRVPSLCYQVPSPC